MNTRNIKRNSVLTVSFSILLAAVALARGQAPRDAIESLRIDLQADRKTVIAQEMNFTSQESDAFWPIYRSYRAEVEKVTDGLVELILEYSDLYPNVPEDKAGELLKQYIKAETNLLSVKTKYLKKLGTVLPASKVFRFAQLDYRLDLGIRTGLAASIPLVPQGASASAGEQR
jgi:hypothetical protein